MAVTPDLGGETSEQTSDPSATMGEPPAEHVPDSADNAEPTPESGESSEEGRLF